MANATGRAFLSFRVAADVGKQIREIYPPSTNFRVSLVIHFARQNVALPRQFFSVFFAGACLETLKGKEQRTTAACTSFTFPWSPDNAFWAPLKHAEIYWRKYVAARIPGSPL